jgi:fructose-1,6-bisphosphatase/inositol monophosphatase family enzyme
MKLEQVGVARFISDLVPKFVAAGRVACKIQDAILAGKAGSIEQKSGGSFASALTDADLLVEGFLGMAILADYEDVAFYGEERAMDRVSTYFPETAPYTVTLDPIDGTLYFKNGLPLFSIIMTVCHDARIVAAVAYLPREERFYVGFGPGKGAYRFSSSTTPAQFKKAVADRMWKHYVLPEQKSSTVILIGKSDLVNRQALENAGFTVVHGDSEYKGQPDWKNGSIRLLSGEVAGLVTRNAQLIDAGAISFIVASAGGKDNGPLYDPSSMLAPRLIVGTSPATYDRIVAALGEK